jgi:hypothetical protein
MGSKLINEEALWRRIAELEAQVKQRDQIIADQASALVRLKKMSRKELRDVMDATQGDVDLIQHLEDQINESKPAAGTV